MFTREEMEDARKPLKYPDAKNKQWVAKMKCVALVVLLSLFCTQTATADAPPPPPQDYDMQNGQYVVHGDVKADKIVVLKKTQGEPIEMWEISPWYQANELSLSPDGQSLVRHISPVIGAGLNQDVLQFFHQGTLTHRWQLKDLFPSTDAIPKTTMHITWARDGRWSGEVYWVMLADGRVMNFDGDTGELRK